MVVKLGARAVGLRARAGTNGRHVVDLSDGSTAEGAAIMFTIGREVPLEDLNLGAIGVEAADGRVKSDAHLRIAPNVYVAGDIAGPELHTHTGHYQGEMAAMLALGDDVTPGPARDPARDLHRSGDRLGRPPRRAGDGAKGIDAVEFTQDLSTTARG